MSVPAGGEWWQIASARNLKAIVDFATASHARAIGLLLVVSLLCFLPGFFSIPPIDRDESRFAQATKQMVETRRLRRHPLPGRGALQEAGRHLLAAGRDGATPPRPPACRARARASGSIAFPR